MNLRTLRFGSLGRDVTTFQQFLSARGFYKAPVDRSFGRAMEAAAKAWQTKHGLEADGIVGQQSWALALKQGIDVVVEPEQDLPLPPADMSPLGSNQNRTRKWGAFTWEDAPTAKNPEGIRITDDFEEKRIVLVRCPILKANVSLHEAVADDYTKFMLAIVRERLDHLILTNDGAFYPRYIRGSRKTLSNHSWGTAFDRNYQWNKLGHMPAFAGEKGSLREIVPLGWEHGWYWGGHFKDRRDGMHFEHV